ncbi:hypothetical protein DW980_06675 [Bacteroides stercoris]|nr:hypothetical protein DW980_06675 [Bacteroides stercoris]
MLYFCKQEKLRSAAPRHNQASLLLHSVCNVEAEHRFSRQDLIVPPYDRHYYVKTISISSLQEYKK